jgi:hypothetical protein
MNRLNEPRLKLYNTWKVAVEQYSDIYGGNGKDFFGFTKEKVKKDFKKFIEVVEQMSDEQVIEEQKELDDYIRWFTDPEYRAQEHLNNYNKAKERDNEIGNNQTSNRSAHSGASDDSTSHPEAVGTEAEVPSKGNEVLDRGNGSSEGNPVCSNAHEDGSV